jgi:hypothetical protein
MSWQLHAAMACAALMLNYGRTSFFFNVGIGETTKFISHI